MLFVVSAVLFDMLKARQLACVSKSGQKCPAALSLSSWRAWIEIIPVLQYGTGPSRSPHGERGLKFGDGLAVAHVLQSLSSWRAWIEITCHSVPSCSLLTSLSSWRAWIEIVAREQSGRFDTSLSSWRAWIEIRSPARPAPTTGSLSSWRAWIEILR